MRALGLHLKEILSTSRLWPYSATLYRTRGPLPHATGWPRARCHGTGQPALDLPGRLRRDRQVTRIEPRLTRLQCLRWDVLQEGRDGVLDKVEERGWPFEVNLDPGHVGIEHRLTRAHRL